MPQALTRADLVRQLRVLRERENLVLGGKTDEDTFPVWVLLAMATRNPRKAAEAECGGKNDGMNDAIFIDKDSSQVWIVQGKLRRDPGVKREEAKYVYAFASLIDRLYEAEADSGDSAYWSRIRGNERVYSLFSEASSLVRDHGYQARLVLATLGKLDRAVCRRATASVTSSDRRATIEFLAWPDVTKLLAYYLRNAAPGPPTLTLEVASGNPVRESMGSGSLTARVFASTGEQVVGLLEEGGEPIFARNIRLDLGDRVKVNRAIEKSVHGDSETFWYLNNGLTIACSSASYDPDAGTITIHDAQVINGQQTTRSLHRVASSNPPPLRNLRRLQVGIRLIEVPPDNPQFDPLIDKIVEATNFQNAIGQADLRTNEIEQIDLERDLAARGYDYVRKRGRRSIGASRPAFVHLRTKVPMRKLATAVGGALHEGLPLRAGQLLFDRDLPYYDEIFKGRSVDSQLVCFWLWSQVENRAKGDSDRQGAKYLVHHDIYRSNRALLRSYAKELIYAFEMKERAVTGPLNRAIDAEFEVGVGSFRANRASRTQTIKAYHQDKEAYPNFQRHWDENLLGQLQTQYEERLTELRSALRRIRES